MINLQHFSSTHRRRYDEPWSDGEFSYATDGFILIRVARQEGIRDISEIPGGAVDIKILEKIIDYKIKDWYPVPNITTKKEICQRCKGTGKVYICPECDGTGHITASTDYNFYHDLYCATCDGTGIIFDEEDRLALAIDHTICDYCDGTGFTNSDEETKIGNAYFPNNLLEKLSELPNCKIGVFDKNEPAQLKFDGGVGLIMPILT